MNSVTDLKMGLCVVYELEGIYYTFMYYYITLNYSFYCFAS